MMTKSLGILPATFVVKARRMERTSLNTFDSEREGSPSLKCVVSHPVLKPIFASFGFLCHDMNRYNT